MSVPLRLAACVGAAMGAAVVSAVVIAIANIYVTGHGGASLLTPVISDPRTGTALGIGDLIMLGVTLAAAIFTWVVTRER